MLLLIANEYFSDICAFNKIHHVHTKINQIINYQIKYSFIIFLAASKTSGKLNAGDVRKCRSKINK